MRLEMAFVPPPVSQILLVVAFVAVASSAGLQWIGLSAQAEAARQQNSRQTLTEFSTLLNLFETAPEREKRAVAQHLTGMAERLSRQSNGESLASASRRVAALTSFETEAKVRDAELQERLQAEVRELVNEAEAMESAALGRATWLSTINQVLLVTAAVLCGMLAFRTRRSSLAA
ncbi:MAG: hypothetical protein ACKV2U_05425 [Bryobacteraceae bacterium]